mgnify:CR=1 FL=1
MRAPLRDEAGRFGGGQFFFLLTFRFDSRGRGLRGLGQLARTLGVFEFRLQDRPVAVTKTKPASRQPSSRRLRRWTAVS